MGNVSGRDNTLTSDENSCPFDFGKPKFEIICDFIEWFFVAPSIIRYFP